MAPPCRHYRTSHPRLAGAFDYQLCDVSSYRPRHCRRRDIGLAFRGKLGTILGVGAVAVADMAKRRSTAMTTLDQISLVFVGVCAVGIAYLVFVEPVRQWLHDIKDKKKHPKH